MTPIPPISGPPTTTPAPLGMSYRTRLVLGIGGLVLLTGAVVTALAHRASTQAADILTDSLFREASSHAVGETQAFADRAPPVAEAVRRLVDLGLATDDPLKLSEQLLAFHLSTPGLSWITYSNEAGTFTGAYRTGQGQLRVNLTRVVDGKNLTVISDILPDGSRREVSRNAASGYDPRERPFYVSAKAADGPVWLPPYVFFNEGVPGTSYAIAIRDKAGAVRGIVSVDFDLNALSKFVAGLSVSPNSRFYLFTADETLLAHPTREVVTVRDSEGKGDLIKLADTDDPLVAAFRGRLSADPIPTGQVKAFQRFDFEHDGTGYLASTTAFRVGDQVWVVGAVAPKADFLAGVWRSRTIALIASGLAVLFAVLIAALLARSVSTPVRDLVAFMRRVGAGDLEARADLGGAREFRELSATLNQMLGDLRDRLRLRHSLDVAMQVQQQLLPTGPPVVKGLDVAGHSTYCDETGGDYYDFLILDQPDTDSLLVVLGDVMGHGIASALVMAGVRAILRDRATGNGEMASLLGRLNNALCSDMDGARFMTMYLAVFEPRTGTLRWASAGHDPALMYDPATDAFSEDDGGDLPLGVMPDTEYTELKAAPLKTGQILLLGTDGVWEMLAPDGELYGKDRLKATIRAHAKDPAAVVVQAILDSLVGFRRERRPTDDVTFVVIKMTGEGVEAVKG